EIGWVVDPGQGGRGLATEAVRAMLDLAFERYGAHRVAAQMDARNTASARLAERVGMHREAQLRQDWWSKGEWTDTVIFAMLARDRSAAPTGVLTLRCRRCPRPGAGPSPRPAPARSPPPARAGRRGPRAPRARSRPLRPPRAPRSIGAAATAAAGSRWGRRAARTAR